MPGRMSHLNPFETPFDGNDENANSQRLTQWPSIPAFPAPPMPGNTPTSSKSTKRRSSQRQSPLRLKSRARQKEQNAKAGIKVVTNFSRPPGPAQQAKQQRPAQPVAPQQAPQAPKFVDRAALQAVSPPPDNGGFWNLFWGSSKRPAPAQQASQLNDTGLPRGLGSWSQHGGSQTSLQNDLSPNDRPIMIGLTIPHDSPMQRGMSPNTAGTEASIIQSYAAQHPNQYMPGTPDIVITPAAAEISYWSPDTASAVTTASRRIPSSIYSRPATSSYYATQPQQSNAPPVPVLPQSVLDRHNRKDSADTIFDDEDETPITFKKKLRIQSSGTMFEEDDQSPILSRKKRASSIGDRLKVKTSLSPSDNRTSFGWWNTIVSPFIPTPRVPRSSTFLSPDSMAKEQQPPMPSLEIPPELQIRQPEKVMSPLSATTIASDDWWDKRTPVDGNFDWEESNAEEKNGAHTHKTKESVSTQNGTLPFMLGETLQNELGLAAERDARQQREPENSQQDHSSSSPINRQGPVTYPAYATITPPSAFNPYPAPLQIQHQRQTPPRMPPTSSGPLHLQLATMSSQVADTPAQSLAARSLSITPSVAPPPYSAGPKFRAIYPPGHVAPSQQPPSSPGPVSPGLQQAMTSTGAIAMEEVPLTPAPAESRRVINLNSGYPTALPPRRGNVLLNAADLENQPERARQIEAKRQKHEKEDALAKKAGGYWRGRGCMPKTGCFGQRSGVEGRRRRRCWLGGCGIFVFLIILVVVLVTQLSKGSSKQAEAPTQWVNLTAFPPMFTGVSTVAAPDNTNENTGCVYPKTIWSCSLPKEMQPSILSNKPNQPNFKWLIQWDNSSAANATWGGPQTPSSEVAKVGNPVSARALIKRLIIEATNVVFSPSPSPPNTKEIAFLANTTDEVTGNFEGEVTPFYISLLDANSTSLALPPVDSTISLNESSRVIPGLETQSDGTAPPASLLPEKVRQQPLRLFDRGLATEHYGFYTYFTRSIFLKSTALLNNSNVGTGEVSGDRNGGSTEGEARHRCSWTETRMLVQVWTNRGSSARLLGTQGTVNNEGKNATELAESFSRPGSFPYPVTVKLDRHGGDPKRKGVFCYQIDERSRPIKGSLRVRPEFRDFGGQLINKATRGGPEDLDGYDGGTGGCACEWKNFGGVVGGV